MGGCEGGDQSALGEMTLRVVYRRAAQAELQEAAVWYEQHRTGLGEEFIREIEAAVVRAAESPKRKSPLVARQLNLLGAIVVREWNASA